MDNKRLSRRTFIGKFTGAVTGALSAPYIITSSALGNDKIPPASDRVTLGHIGVGGQGGWLLRNFLQLDHAQSIAVCDTFQYRREERVNEIDDYYAEKMVKSSYKGCKAFKDFRDLLMQKDIDAVIIATPDHWHVPIALAASKACKDMYVEKPLGISVKENQALREAIHRYGNIFQYGTQQRSGRDFRLACELTRNGLIGKLHTIHVWCADISSQALEFNQPGGSMKPIPIPEGFDYDMWLGQAPETPYTSDRCTNYGTYHVYDNSLGFIAGWGAHPLDIAQWGNNTDDTAPVEYEGHGTIADQGLYDTVSNWDMRCLYKNGVKMLFKSTDIARPIVQKYHPDFIDHGTTFIGTEGWVSVDRHGLFAEPVSLLKSIIRPDEVHLYNSANHYKNFVDCIKTRQQTISPINAAVQSDIISHLCDISIRLSRKIKWDPEKEEIIGDETASRKLSRAMRSPWRLL